MFSLSDEKSNQVLRKLVSIKRHISLTKYAGTK